MKDISKIARRYIGQREISGNQGFRNKDFESQMRDAGFYTGAAWCGFFCRMVWKEAGAMLHGFDDKQTVKTIVTGSAVKSMKVAVACGNFHTWPVKGAVAVWRRFNDNEPTDTGHMGIVVDCEEYTAKTVPFRGAFDTVEGNTNDKGGREGLIVAERMRSFAWKVDTGLRLMGFIHPK